MRVIILYANGVGHVRSLFEGTQRTEKSGRVFGQGEKTYFEHLLGQTLY